MTAIVKVQVSQTIAPAPATLQKTGACLSQGGTILAKNATSLLTQPSDLTPLLKAPAALTSLAYSGGTVTAATASPHGYTTSDTIFLTIAGAAPSGYNGTFLCTITGASAFTYTLPSDPGSETLPGTYVTQSAIELFAMVETLFSQGANQAVYVLELGAGSVNEGVATLGAWITANPMFFYSYLVPREWDGNANYIAFLAPFQSLSAKTYFFTTTTLATYTLYSALDKCVVALIEAPNYGVWNANTLTALSASSKLVTGTTTTAHGVVAGQYFSISGCTPAAYNGTFLALPGTTGSTLIYNALTAPGAESVLGTLVASAYASTGIPVTEFTLAGPFRKSLNYAPAPTNKVTPFSFSYVFGVTPFPTQGNAALLQTLKAAFVNIIDTGSEGGITNTILKWGTTLDGRDFTYWYSVDWVQINGQRDLANAIINGSNNPVNPLYYDQPGINRLRAVLAGTMSRGVSYGLVLGNVVQTNLDGDALDAALDAGTYDDITVVNSVPFLDYVEENPDDYPAGIYDGLATVYTPQRGFTSITFNVQVTDFVSA